MYGIIIGFSISYSKGVKMIFLADTLRLFRQLIIIGVVSFAVINLVIWAVDKFSTSDNE